MTAESGLGNLHTLIMGKGKNLKAALQSQQSRLKAKEKLSHAAQVAEQRSHRNAKQQYSKGFSGNLPSNNLNSGEGKATPAPPPRRTTLPFRPTDTILLIGEGNFSFARALLCDSPAELRDLPPRNLTATAYDTEDECYEKYADAREIVAYLRQRGAQILFGVDATKLEKTTSLKGRRWDRIVWNFPHAGSGCLVNMKPYSWLLMSSLLLGKGITDQDRNILSNQVLILGFLRSAAKVLSLGPVPSVTTPRKRRKADDDEDEDDVEEETVPTQAEEGEQFKFITPKEAVKTRGTVLITLRNVVPYTLWYVCMSFTCFQVMTLFLKGMCHDLLKNRHCQRREVHQLIRDIRFYVRFPSIEVYIKDTSTA